MKLAKAIEISTDYVKDGSFIPNPDIADSIKLLIEAGKRLEEMRHYKWKGSDPLLPGETPDSKGG